MSLEGRLFDRRATWPDGPSRHPARLAGPGASSRSSRLGAHRRGVAARPLPAGVPRLPAPAPPRRGARPVRRLARRRVPGGGPARAERGARGARGLVDADTVGRRSWCGRPRRRGCSPSGVRWAWWRRPSAAAASSPGCSVRACPRPSAPSRCTSSRSRATACEDVLVAPDGTVYTGTDDGSALGRLARRRAGTAGGHASPDDRMGIELLPDGRLLGLRRRTTGCSPWTRPTGRRRAAAEPRGGQAAGPHEQRGGGDRTAPSGSPSPRGCTR